MNNNIDELNELRSKYNLLSEELNRQEIINDKFVKTAIDRSIRRVKSARKQVLNLDLIAMIIFDIIVLGFKISGVNSLSWATIIFANVLIIAEYITNKKLHNILGIENLHSKVMKEYLINIKEYRRLNRICRSVDYIIGMPLAIMIAYDLSNGETYGFIGFVILLLAIAIPIDFFFERKMKKSIKEIEDIINDINQ